MQVCLGLAVVLTMLTQAHAEASPVLRADDSPIDYYLTSSSVAPAEALLLILQGSDCNSVKHNSLVQQKLRSIWPSADRLTIEKPGITAGLSYSSDPEREDCPPAYLKHDNPVQRAEDATRVLRHILPNSNYKKLIVVGGSEGAAVAAHLAATSYLPDAVVLINGGGRHFMDDVLFSIQAQAKENSRDLDDFRDFARHILASKPFDLRVSNHGYSWWHASLTMDLQNALQKISVPVLVVQAEQDKSVAPAKVAEMITQLKAFGKTNVDLIVYPDLDHGLQNSAGKDRTDEVVREIHEWLKRRLGESEG